MNEDSPATTDTDKKRKCRPKSPPGACNPSSAIDDRRCRDKGIAAQLAYTQEQGPKLDDAQKRYDQARKDYRVKRHDAALQVQDMKHDVKYLIEQIKCRIEQERVVRCLDDAFVEVCEQLDCCEGSGGCCTSEFEFDAELPNEGENGDRKLAHRIERYKAEIAKVRKIQAAALPDFTRVGGYDIAYTFLPAEDISGDFFDGFFLDESTYQIVLCDVSGHGMASSYVGNEIRSLFRSVSRPELFPADTLAEVNKLLFMDIAEINYFGTAIVCRFDLLSGDIVFASAGHPPVVVYQEHDESHALYESTGPLIGFFESASFKQVVLHPSQGDCILLYTDGITETISPITGELFGERRLVKYFSDSATLQPREIIQEIIGNVYEFAEFTNQSDDITMICIKKLGSPYA